MAVDVAAIVLSLGLLMVIAYRGLPVIVFAPLCAGLATLLSGADLLPSYTETFMGGTAGFVRSFFPVFLLGAVFGKLMETSGSAEAIAAVIVRTLGPRRAIPAVVLSCALLTYGGVSLFVVAFAVYPFGAALFREAGMPKRLLPATIALGAFTFTMDALPGTPQVQNLIPTRWFGTDIYAAPLIGCTGALLILTPGLGWLGFRRRQAERAGEGYGSEHVNEPEQVDRKRPHLMLAILPLVLVLVANFLLSRSSWSIVGLYAGRDLGKSFPGVDLKAAGPTWSLIASLLLGIVTTCAISPGRVGKDFARSLNMATAGALLAIFNTASEVGFGTVIKGLPGFAAVRGWVLGSGNHVLISEAVGVNVLAGMTGSASGGLSIALEVMGPSYLEAAKVQGISPELLHRIAAMSSGGMDTLPHNGAVITLLAITGLTHRKSYGDIFVLTLIKTGVVFLLAALATFRG